MRRKKEFYEYPKRTCYSMHYCEVCDSTIHAMQEYYDGGYGKRCHVACAPPIKQINPTLDNPDDFVPG